MISAAALFALERYRQNVPPHRRSEVLTASVDAWLDHKPTFKDPVQPSFDEIGSYAQRYESWTIDRPGSAAPREDFDAWLADMPQPPTTIDVSEYVDALNEALAEFEAALDEWIENAPRDANSYEADLVRDLLEAL